MNPIEDSFEQELSGFLPVAPRQEWFNQVRELMDREYEEHGYGPSTAGLYLLPMVSQEPLKEHGAHHTRHDRRWMAAAAALMLAGPLMVIKMQSRPVSSNDMASSAPSSAVVTPGSKSDSSADRAGRVLPASSIRQEVSAPQDQGLILQEGKPFREYIRESVETHDVIEPQTGNVIRVKKPTTQIIRVPAGN